jgi:hypothetical protein
LRRYSVMVSNATGGNVNGGDASTHAKSLITIY